MWSIGLYLATLLAICFIFVVFKRRNSRNNEVVLPPGSKGFPLIGETLQILLPSYSLDLPTFVRSRIQRYGPIFQTRILGKPLVVSADLDFNRYIVQQEGKLVELWYFGSAAKLFALEGEGRANAAGFVHKFMRKHTLKHFGSENIQGNLFPHLHDWVRKSLNNWSTQESIVVREAALMMVVEFAAKEMFGYDAEKSEVKIGEAYASTVDGFFSIPVNIPGTAHHRCLKNKRLVMDMMSGVLKERLASPSTYRGDFLDHALQDLNTDKFLTEEFIVQTMFNLLFATAETLSSTLTLILKFLSENPNALEELEAEHERILTSRSESPDSPLTWSELKSMTFTLQVINESLRLGNISFGLSRKALKDIQINGYTIPAGWAIILITSAFQYNPDTYKDPLTFNPWRWEEMKPEVISKTFMPFGGGIRQCAGAEFAKVTLTTILHVLVTKYRWKKIKGGKIARIPMLVFKDELHISLAPKNGHN